MTKRRLFIEAGSIAERNMSGVGHTTLSLIRELAKDGAFQDRYTIFLIVPFNKVELVKGHNLPGTVKIRKIYIPGRIVNGLARFNKLPYMDLFFGQGIYLFPNFKNWPLLRSKNITYIHDVYFKIAPEHIESRNLDLLVRNTERFIKRATIVVTVSNHAKQEIEKFFPVAKDKVRVVYNGIDHTLYHPRTTDEQNTIAEKYGLVVKKYFIFFSNIEPRKNVEVLLDAYKQFIDEIDNRDIALILVGGMGWANELIIKKMKSLQDQGYKVIKPSVYVPDNEMPALLSGSIALVHPALYEGFGLTPLEAMACATPVIVGNNSSLPEVMGDEYRGYVDVYSASSIKDAMIDRYRHPLVNNDGVARARHFSWSESARRLKDVIEGV